MSYKPKESKARERMDLDLKSSNWIEPRPLLYSSLTRARLVDFLVLSFLSKSAPSKANYEGSFSFFIKDHIFFSNVYMLQYILKMYLPALKMIVYRGTKQGVSCNTASNVILSGYC